MVCGWWGLQSRPIIDDKRPSSTIEVFPNIVAEELCSTQTDLLRRHMCRKVVDVLEVASGGHYTCQLPLPAVKTTYLVQLLYQTADLKMIQIPLNMDIG